MCAEWNSSIILILHYYIMTSVYTTALSFNIYLHAEHTNYLSIHTTSRQRMCMWTFMSVNISMFLCRTERYLHHFLVFYYSLFICFLCLFLNCHYDVTSKLKLAISQVLNAYMHAVLYCIIITKGRIHVQVSHINKYTAVTMHHKQTKAKWKHKRLMNKWASMPNCQNVCFCHTDIHAVT